MNRRYLMFGLGIAATVVAIAGPSTHAQEPGNDAATQASEVVDGASLVGTWKVDLRPTPDSEAYYQEFVVESVEGRSFSGTFYGTAIEDARLNTDWGAVRFAFVTRDNSGAYHHSGVLRGDRLEGLTHSLGRDFLAVWSAVRHTPAEE